MYQIDSRNVKANAFTRMFDSLPKSENDVRIQHQQQIILTSKRLKIRIMNLNSKLFLYARIMKVNKFSDECIEFRIALTRNKKKYKNIKLTFCSIKHDVLYYDKRV